MQIADTHNLSTAVKANGNWFFEWEFEPPALDANASPRQLENLQERHGNVLNCLFCDGHVKAMSLDTLSQRNAAGTLTAFTIEAD